MSFNSGLRRRDAWLVAVPVVVAMLCASPRPAAATEAWSMTGPACTPLVGGAVVDNITHSFNAYGAYVTFAGGGDDEAYLWCPVWLPQGTTVDTITVRAYRYGNSGEMVRATFYSQPANDSGGSYTSLGDVLAANEDTDAKVASASFSTVTICNYNAGTTGCDGDDDVQNYHVLVRLGRNNYTPRFYSVWIGESSSKGAETHCSSCPIDCGRAIERQQVGATLTTEELVCLPPRSWDGLRP